MKKLCFGLCCIVWLLAGCAGASMGYFKTPDFNQQGDPPAFKLEQEGIKIAISNALFHSELEITMLVIADENYILMNPRLTLTSAEDASQTFPLISDPVTNFKQVQLNARQPTRIVFTMTDSDFAALQSSGSNFHLNLFNFINPVDGSIIRFEPVAMEFVESLTF